MRNVCRAVYDARSSRNEEKSAEWAVESLRDTDLSPEQLSRIRDLILATRHGDPSEAGDPALMVDIDLAILGAEPDDYQRYEVAIRQEYRWVPRFLFRKKRCQILQSFLDRPAIYGTEELRARFEESARRNLERAIVWILSLDAGIRTAASTSTIVKKSSAISSIA